MENIIRTLNPAQRKAVEHLEGPLLVIAGAGSGKTRVITYRIVNLIQNGIEPSNILAVTFTNKAAAEMRTRISDALREHPGSQGDALPFVATFHSLGVHILRAYGERDGVKKRFAILDQSDSRSLVKRALIEAGYDPDQFEPKRVQGAISKAKGEGDTPDTYSQKSAESYFGRVVLDAWERYERMLKEEGSLDFDDLLLKSVLLLRKHQDIRDDLRKRFSHVHIDEYQDTNDIQHTLARLIVGEANNICVVGDIDQNIYSWRGARITHMLQFEKQYPDTTVIALEENYRSTKTIVAASNGVIAKNLMRKEKNVFTQNEDGERICLYGAYDENDEARFVVDTIEKLRREGKKLGDIAVLYRANFLSRVLEEHFLRKGVPYQILGVRFFDRKEVKDLVSYVRLAYNRDNTADLARVINTPARGIGKVTLLKLIEGRRSELTASTKKRVDDFYTLLDRCSEAISQKPPSEAMKFVMQASGMEEELKKEGAEGVERLENLFELIGLAKQYDAEGPAGMDRFLESVALRSEQDEIKDTTNAVRLMTVHAAKGLEFGTVFIVGLEEGLFPHERNESDGVDEEEERRLFYVALTRAKERIFLSFASSRMLFGSRAFGIPSSFINDIDAALIEVLGVQASPKGLLDDGPWIAW